MQRETKSAPARVRPSELHWVLLLLALFCGASLNAFAQTTSRSEYQVKAAFIFNFTKFIEWPPTAFSTSSAPFVIGILGENPFGDALDHPFKGQEMNGHPFVVKRLARLSEAKGCHLLFISASERRRLPQMMEAVDSLPVLTVSETDGFLQAGGMINLVMENRKVHFAINDAAAKRVGLKISSKLLSLGKTPD